MFLGTLGLNDNPYEMNENWHGAPMYWSHYDRHTNRHLLQSAGFQIELDEVTGRPGDQFVLFRAKKP